MYRLPDTAAVQESIIPTCRELGIGELVHRPPVHSSECPGLGQASRLTHNLSAHIVCKKVPVPLCVCTRRLLGMFHQFFQLCPLSPQCQQDCCYSQLHSEPFIPSAHSASRLWVASRTAVHALLARVEVEPVARCTAELAAATAGIVAYSPLGRGMLTGAIKSAADLHESDGRATRMPRFQGENFDQVCRWCISVPHGCALTGQATLTRCAAGACQFQMAVCWQGKPL